MAKRKTKARNPRGALDNPVVASNPEGGDQGADPTSKRAWECWRQTRTHLRDWRNDSSESYDFVAGRQWAEEDLASLEEQQRVPITFNRTHPTTAAVTGYEINNRQEVTYLPRDPTTGSGMAEVDTAAAKYFRGECDAEDQESAQFNDTLITGYGWTEHRMDYDEDPDGLLKVERVDPLEMGYDPAARAPNLTDRDWDIRGKWWDKTKAEAKWSDHDFDQPVPTTYDNDDLDGKQPVDRMEAAFYKAPGVGEQGQTRKDKVFILEFTWFEQEPFYSVVNPTTGKVEDVEPKIHEALQKRLEESGYPRARSVRRTKKKFKRAFIHARDTLEEGDAPCPENFHYQCITGHRDRNKNTWFGMVQAMKDPQRWANKWLSQFLHMLNTNVKNGIWYEDGAFENVGAVERKVAKPGFLQKVNAGYLEKFKKDEPTPIPQDAMGLMEYAISSIRDVTGVNVELLGAQNENQTGVVEAHRKQSAMTILAPLFASQRQYRKAAGRLTLYFIREYLSDGRWIRIAGPANAKFVQLARSETSAKYDIIVDQSPLSTNVKEAVFSVLSTILPVLIKQGVPIPPEVLDYVPGLPAQLADKWKQALIKKESQPPAADPKTQLAEKKLEQDAQESKNQDDIDRQRLAFDKEQAAFAAWKEQRELEFKEKELQFKRQELGSEEDQHLATLSHELIAAHHDRQHEVVEGARGRAHEAGQKDLDRKAAARRPAASKGKK